MEMKMTKQLLCLAGAIFLVAGIAQAEEQAGPDARLENSGGGQYSAEREAPAARDKQKNKAAEKAGAASVTAQKEQVSAKPVYLDGGHFGGEK
jgi:hypothetical protein